MWSTHQSLQKTYLEGIQHPLHYASPRPSVHRDDLALAVFRNCIGKHQDHVLLCDGVWVQEDISQHYFPVRVLQLGHHLCPKKSCAPMNPRKYVFWSQLGRITRSLVLSAPISTFSRSHEMPDRSKPCFLAHLCSGAL